ncbi:amidohydrolase 2 [Glonium stellatum]|uniref:Amidohydrolase 2 n=1 Tax=Glonium stellatum TaxID=574774 RepID=A0A8E2ETK1_9PEZI|nr:amidohydrolase 2 [Glonium stellatum]
MTHFQETASLPLIALEEQYLNPEVISTQDSAQYSGLTPICMSKLKTTGPSRLRDMRNGGISMQVLSHVPVNLNPSTCRKANDALYSAIVTNSGKFAAFALLPLAEPKEAANELIRCIQKYRFVGALINSHHHGEFLDKERFWPLFAAAEEFKVPLYIHPNFPAPSFAPHYRGDYAESIAISLSTSDWGWHSETGLCILRLFAAGVFDRHPRIRLIIGQMGQMIPFMLDHIISTIQNWPEKPRRSFKDVWLNNIWVTTSGMFSMAPMACLVNTMPPTRILFSVGYPFSGNDMGKGFIEDLRVSGLVTQEELEGIAFRNAERLLGLKAQK